MRTRTNLLLVTSTFAALTAATPALASYKPSVTPLSVYQGCDIPKAVNGAKTYYVDPVNGLDTNDGSQAKPWKSLATVITTKIATQNYKRPFTGEKMAVSPSGSVRPGDTILLQSGNYGSVTLVGTNDAFITLKAAPGAKPIITRLITQGADKWIIQGISFFGNPGPNTPIVAMQGNGTWGPSSNIIFDGNRVSTIEDGSAWTPQEYQDKGAFRGVYVVSTHIPNIPNLKNDCFAVTNNTISYIQRGIGIFGHKTFYGGNTIDMFGGGDALSFGANNLRIFNNYITNAVQRVTENHIDAMQGQTGIDPNMTYSNIEIDRNLVILKSKPGVVSEPGMQGISAFDANWDKLSVTNNIVVLATYHGMTWGGVLSGNFANNTVINDGTTSNKTTWISVTKGKTKYKPSQNVSIRNNVSNVLYVDSSIPNLTLDNNLAERGAFILADGKVVRPVAPGSYGTNKFITNLTSGFNKYSPSTFEYDLKPTVDSPVINIGSNVNTPTTDFAGKARSAPFDVGAYELPTAEKPAVPGVTSTGTITVKANARQLGAPTLVVSLNGQEIGRAVVTANSGLGQTAQYSFNYAIPSAPKNLTVAVDKFGGTGNVSNTVATFNVIFDPAGPARANIQSTVPSNVVTGNVSVLPKVTKYFTNGAVNFDVSGIK